MFKDCHQVVVCGNSYATLDSNLLQDELIFQDNQSDGVKLQNNVGNPPKLRMRSDAGQRQTSGSDSHRNFLISIFSLAPTNADCVAQP